MITCESTHGRRVIGRLDKGSDIVRALTEVAVKHRVRTATLTGLGALDEVEICEYDQRNRVYRPSRKFAGVFEVLNLTGNISDRDGKAFLHAHITVSRERDNGIEVLGGHLLSGRVFAFEFVLDVLDDVVLKRTMDQATGLTLWSDAIAFEPEPHVPAASGAAFAVAATPAAADARAPAPSVPTPAADWQEVMAASAARPSAAPTDEEVHLRPGDFIEHPKFGRCRVERLEGDEFAQVRLPNQRMVRLSLDVLSFELAGEEGKARIFKARLGNK